MSDHHIIIGVYNNNRGKTVTPLILHSIKRVLIYWTPVLGPQKLSFGFRHETGNVE